MNWTHIQRGVAGAAALLLFSSAANAQVAGSAHDLSTDPGSQTNEVCVYCHTPHGADTSAVVPLWNKTLPSSTYQRYSDLNTSTLTLPILVNGRKKATANIKEEDLNFIRENSRRKKCILERKK